MKVFYQVPSRDIRNYYLAQLSKARAEKERARIASSAHYAEFKRNAVPALSARYNQELAKWDKLDPKTKKNTRRPKLEIDNHFPIAHIILYEKKTIASTLHAFSYWGRENKDRWYEAKWIKVEDVYTFTNKTFGIDCRLINRIEELTTIARNYEIDFLFERY